jgi:trimeric autotransporter adhesin
VWTQQGYLRASNADIGDGLGEAVAVSGRTVVLGVEKERSASRVHDQGLADNSARSAGAVYVFEKAASGGVWAQAHYLKAPNGNADDSFGHSVGVRADRIVVGATGEDSRARGVDGEMDDDGARVAGAAYVFRRQVGLDGLTSEWVHEAYLKASNTDLGDLFGSAVAITDQRVFVGAVGEDSAVGGLNGTPLAQANNSVQ